MVPPLVDAVDAAPLAELFGFLAITDDRAKPVSSNVERTSAMDAAAEAAEATHISSVKLLHVTTPLRAIDHISILSFSSSVNLLETAQPLINTTKSCF